MRKALIVCGIVTVGLVAVGGALLSHRSSEQPRLGTGDGTSQVEGEDRSSGESGESAEVRLLQARLAKKDAIIASLLAAKVQDGQRKSDPVEAPATRAERVAKVLDERLSLPPSSPADLERIESDIRSSIKSGGLRTTQVVDLRCAGSLCRLILNDDDQTALEGNTVTFSRTLGKASGGLLAIDKGPGQKILYLAKNSEDLAVSLPGDTTDQPVIIRKEDTKGEL